MDEQSEMRADVIRVADFGDRCGECPVWEATTRSLYWTDLAGHRFYRYARLEDRAVIVHEQLQINGFRLNRAGGFIITNPSGAWYWDGKVKLRAIGTQVDGFKCQLNDCATDPAGRLVAGSNFYKPDRSYELGKLFSFEPNGSHKVLDDGFHLANGIDFSPDGKVLYFTDSVARRIYCYHYDVPTGNARDRRVFVQVPVDEGIPDGLTVDAEGYVWSAQWYGSCVTRYDPDGRLQQRIAIPAKQTSACAFGGAQMDELYITSAGLSEVIPVAPPDYDGNSGYIGGALFRVRPGVQGRPTTLANFPIV